MKKILIIFTLFFVSIQNLTASTFPPGTIISSNETITQDWITNHPAPWEIQGGGVIVTFGENLNLNNSNHYFVINGTNVTIDGANKIVTLNGISNFSGLVNATSLGARSALIKNIGVETTLGTSLTTYSGYISGSFNRAEIRNCYSTGVISGLGTGGIVGFGSSGNISNCFSTGDISDINSGGIASYTYDGLISNCFSTGDISGTSSGGIVGYGAYSTDIQNCYSSGNISVGIGAAAIVPPHPTWPGSVTNSGNSSGWNNTDADRYLTGEDGSIWNTSNTPYTLLSFVSGPTFANSGSITMCELGSYYLAPSTTDGTWATSTPTVASVNSSGYVTALSTGTTEISLTTGGGTVTATITVNNLDNGVTPITDGQASYKINNTNPLPQGPLGLGSGSVIYMGYNGFNYSSITTPPTNTGYYRANNVDLSTKTAGCPYPFYIFRCTTCPDPIELY